MASYSASKWWHVTILCQQAAVALTACLVLGQADAQNITTPASLLRGVTVTDDHDIRDSVSIKQALAWDAGYPTYTASPSSGTKVPGTYTPVSKNLCIADTSECDGDLGSVSKTTTSPESLGGLLNCPLP